MEHVFDTKDGILAALTSLDDLNQLREARAQAVANNQTEEWPLKEFVILGSFMLDSQGGCRRLDTAVYPLKHRQDAPLVMNGDETAKWHDEVRGFPSTGPIELAIRWGRNPYTSLPPSGMPCAACQQILTVEDCREYEDSHGIEDLPLEDFIGKTLSEARAAIEARKDGIWKISLANLHNPQRDSEEPNTTWETVIQAGDSTTSEVRRFYHGPCHEKFLAERGEQEIEEQRQYYEMIFQEAAFDDAAAEVVPIPEGLINWLSCINPGVDWTMIGTYFRISSSNPSLTFGVLVLPDAPPAIDLTGTGVQLRDLVSAADLPVEEDPPPGMPELLKFTGQIETLLAFRRAFVQWQKRATRTGT